MREESESSYMQLALTLGLQARVTAPPNPWVGCVLVKKGQIVGTGYSQPAGQAHAEVMALRMAGGQAEGATAYITLEPCSHHGRTPPCVEALVRANIKEVVIGIIDPDPRVSGSGIAFLKERGIPVEISTLEEEVRQSLLPYLYHRKTGMPFVVGKAAISVDGRLAAQDSTSQWISSPEARIDAHRLRAESQAILIGVGTALADLPTLTVRDSPIAPIKQPLRVVIDSAGKLTMDCPLLDRSFADTLIATSSLCPQSTLSFWEKKGVQFAVFEEQGGKISLEEVLRHLGKLGIIQVLVEGGSRLLGEMVNKNLLHELFLYVGPKILGDSGIPLFGNTVVERIDEAPHLHLKSTAVFGTTVSLHYQFFHFPIFNR